MRSLNLALKMLAHIINKYVTKYFAFYSRDLFLKKGH